MAIPAVELLLRAKDEASGKVKALAEEVGGLSGTVERLSAGLGVWGAIAAGVTAAGAAVVAVTHQFADHVVAIDRVRAATGAQRSEIQALQLAFKEQGLSEEDASKALEKMAKAIGNHEPLLKKLGITTRNVFEATVQASRAMGNTDAAERQAIAIKLFGRTAGEAVGPVMELGRSAEELKHKLDQSGAGITDADAERAHKLHEAFNELSLAMEGLKKETASSLAPAATGIVSSLTSILAVFPHLLDAAKEDESHGLLWWLKKNRDEGDKAGFAWISDLNSQVDALMDRLHKLNPLLFAAAGHWQGVQQSGPHLEDLFAGAGSEDLDKEKPAAPEPSADEKAREKRLGEIIKLLRVGRTEAEAFLRILEGIEQGKKTIALRKELFEGRGGTGDPADLVKVQPRERGDLGRVDWVHDVQGPQPKAPPTLIFPPTIDAPVVMAKLDAQVDTLTEKLPKLGSAIDSVNQRWSVFAQNVSAPAGTVDWSKGEQGPEPAPAPTPQPAQAPPATPSTKITTLLPAVDAPVVTTKLGQAVDTLTDKLPKLGAAIADVNAQWTAFAENVSAPGTVDWSKGEQGPEPQATKVPAAPKPSAPRVPGQVGWSRGEQGPQPTLVPGLPIPKLGAIDTLIDRFPRLAEAITDVSIKWGEFTQQTLSTAGIVAQTYDALYAGLENGIQRVVAGMHGNLQTLRGAFHTIFGAIGQEFEQLAEHLIAVKIFTFLLNFLPGVGKFLSAGAGAAGGGAFSSFRSVQQQQPRQPQVTNVNLTVQAIDSADAARSALLPFGGLRLAAERLG